MNFQTTLDKIRKKINVATSDKVVICVHKETSTSAPIIHTMNGDSKTSEVSKKISKFIDIFESYDDYMRLRYFSNFLRSAEAIKKKIDNSNIQSDLGYRIECKIEVCQK